MLELLPSWRRTSPAPVRLPLTGGKALIGLV